jgi:hypothetical protein
MGFSTGGSNGRVIITWNMTARSRGSQFNMRISQSTTGELNLSTQSACVPEPKG